MATGATSDKSWDSAMAPAASKSVRCRKGTVVLPASPLLLADYEQIKWKPVWRQSNGLGRHAPHLPQLHFPEVLKRLQGILGKMASFPGADNRQLRDGRHALEKLQEVPPLGADFFSQPGRGGGCFGSWLGSTQAIFPLWGSKFGYNLSGIGRGQHKGKAGGGGWHPFGPKGHGKVTIPAPKSRT